MPLLHFSAWPVQFFHVCFFNPWDNLSVFELVAVQFFFSLDALSYCRLRQGFRQYDRNWSKIDRPKELYPSNKV